MSWGDEGQVGEVRGRGLVLRLAFGAMGARVVGLATELGLPDSIGDAERTAAELAAELDLPEANLNRLLRAMAALELLTETAPGRFVLAPAGAVLRTDRPDSIHSFVRMFTDSTMVRAWERLEYSVRTGRTAFDEVFGTDFFDHLKGDAELSALFNAAMSQGSRRTAALLPEHVDFGRFGTVTDVGGGDGTLLAAVLRAVPALRGTVFDTAEGGAQAAATLERAGVADRAAVAVGDFFAGVPAGADAYLLKSIVHDWDDERAASILGHCGRGLAEGGRVLIVEPVLPDTVRPDISPTLYLSDLNMLVNVGGLERTRADFEALCTRAGLAVDRVVALPPESGFCVIEAVPA